MSSTATHFDEIEVVVLEHGFLGTSDDLEHIGRCVQRENEELREKNTVKGAKKSDYNPIPLSPEAAAGAEAAAKRGREFIVLNHTGNNKYWGAMFSLATCGDRLAAYVVDSVAAAVHKKEKQRRQDSMSGAKPCSSLKIIMHMIGYSMGGLIVRTALPTLQREFDRRYPSSSSSKGKAKTTVYCSFQVEWRHLFCLCTPHLGCSYISSSSPRLQCLLTRCCCLVPAAVRDMLLNNHFVEDVLTSPSYLEAIRRFRTKIFVACTHDKMVWNYSSGLVLSPLEQFYAKGGDLATPRLNVAAVPTYIPASARCADTPQEEGLPQYDPEQRTADTPWLSFDPRDTALLEYNEVFLHSLGAYPASTLWDMQRNGVIIKQSCGASSPFTVACKGTDGTAQSGGKGDSQGVRYPLHVCEGSWINESTWPATLLPREREMAQRFLEGAGPIELHFVDFVPAAETYLDKCVRRDDPSKIPTDPQLYSLMLEVWRCGHQLIIFSSEYEETVGGDAEYQRSDGSGKKKAAAPLRRLSLPVAPSLTNHEMEPHIPHLDVCFVWRFVVWRIIYGEYCQFEQIDA